MQRRLAELPDPLQGLRDLARFPVQLVFVMHVLIATPAAATEVRTLRRRPLRRRLHHPNECSLGKRFLFLNDPRRDSLTLDCEGNKDRFSCGARNAFSAERDVVDDQLKLALHRLGSHVRQRIVGRPLASPHSNTPVQAGEAGALQEGLEVL